MKSKKLGKLQNCSFNMMLRNDEDIIPLKEETIDDLNRVGKKDQTYDDIIMEMMTHCGMCDKFWVDRF